MGAFKDRPAKDAKDAAMLCQQELGAELLPPVIERLEHQVQVYEKAHDY